MATFDHGSSRICRLRLSHLGLAPAAWYYSSEAVTPETSCGLACPGQPGYKSNTPMTRRHREFCMPINERTHRGRNPVNDNGLAPIDQDRIARAVREILLAVGEDPDR